MADNVPEKVQFEGEENKPSTSGFVSLREVNVQARGKKVHSSRLVSATYDSDSEFEFDDSDLDPLYKDVEVPSSDDSDSDVPLNLRKGRKRVKRSETSDATFTASVYGDPGPSLMPMQPLELVGEGGGTGEGVAVERVQTGTVPSTESDDADNEEEEEQRTRRSRKGIRQPDKWQKNISQKQRNLGKSYFSLKTKKVVAARKLGQPCKDGCFERIGMENVKEIFENFWAMGDINRQNAYLVNLIGEESYKRKYTKAAVSKRPVRLTYTVIHDNTEYQVCREGFLGIHSIGRKKLELMVAKKREAKASTGVPTLDKRGLNVKGNVVSSQKVESLHSFLRSLPVVSSHYSRAKAPHAQYLPFGGSIKGLYAEYLVFMMNKNREVEPVKESFFRKVFATKYNIRFEAPQADKCNLCAEKDVLISRTDDENEKAEHNEIKQKHLEEAQAARDNLNNPQNTQQIPGFRAITIDLQQQQPIPKMPVNKAYYTSKLWFLNFCIHDMTYGVSNMFVWDETVAKRGPNEISSCLLRWLDHVRETQGSEVNHLRIYADNCAGQNKNIFNILMFLQQIQKKLLNRVELIFLVSGHSFLPCDQKFSIIEKEYRKQPYICSKERYVALIKSASKTGKFQVFEMEQNHFFDVKALAKHITNRSAGLLSKGNQFVLQESHPHGFFIKNHYDLSDDNMTYINLQKGKQSKSGRGRPQTILRLADQQLNNKYIHEILLKRKKIDSLASILQYIPIERDHQWLSSVIHRQRVMDNMSMIHIERDSDDDIADDEIAINAMWDEPSVLVNPDDDLDL